MGNKNECIFTKSKDTTIKILFLTCMLLLPSRVYGGWGASNIYECLLDNLPEVKNDPAAIEIYKKCKKDYPTTPFYIKKKEPIFGVKTAGECVTKYAKDVTSPKGAIWIRASCYKLYNQE